MFHLGVMTAAFAALAIVAWNPKAFIWLVAVELMTTVHHAQSHHPASPLGHLSWMAGPVPVVIAAVLVVIYNSATGSPSLGRDAILALLGMMALTQVASLSWHRFQHTGQRAWTIGIALGLSGALGTALLLRGISPA